MKELVLKDKLPTFIGNFPTDRSFKTEVSDTFSDIKYSRWESHEQA